VLSLSIGCSLISDRKQYTSRSRSWGVFVSQLYICRVCHRAVWVCSVHCCSPSTSHESATWLQFAVYAIINIRWYGTTGAVLAQKFWGRGVAPSAPSSPSPFYSFGVIGILNRLKFFRASNTSESGRGWSVLPRPNVIEPPLRRCTWPFDRVMIRR